MKATSSVQAEHKINLKNLEEKLRRLDLGNLAISDYSKRYFGDYLRKLTYGIQACAFIVESSLANTDKKPKDLIFIDHGGGIGLLSIIAKMMGMGKVIYSDIYDVATRDAQVLAEAIGVHIDHYVAGDVDELLNYMHTNKLDVDIIASRNVIEHVFNPSKFIEKIAQINQHSLQLFFATTANIENPMVNIYTRRIHKKLEYQGMGKAWGNKERDQVMAYLDIRKNIILQNFPGLIEEEVDMLAKKTRGYIKEDILDAIKAFILYQTPPIEIQDPTNTCDPLTGNWAEHLIPIAEYEKMFVENGFSFQLVYGFYNTAYPQKMLNTITPLLNFFIEKMPFTGKFLAPFIGLSGYRK